jgi:hypothetical protein
MTGATEEMYNLIHATESKSYETCEECGAPGKRRGGGWILTLCDTCCVKRGKDANDEEDEEDAVQVTSIHFEHKVETTTSGNKTGP